MPFFQECKPSGLFIGKVEVVFCIRVRQKEDFICLFGGEEKRFHALTRRRNVCFIFYIRAIKCDDLIEAGRVSVRIGECFDFWFIEAFFFRVLFFSTVR